MASIRPVTVIRINLSLLDGSCAVALNSAVLSQMNDTNKPNKVRCSRCDFMVVAEGHEERCRIGGYESRGGWDDDRYAAWLGDSVQAMDVKLALLLSNVPGAELSTAHQKYVSNASMAAYMRSHGLAPEGRSDHFIATLFESRYYGEFRLAYLVESFPDVGARVYECWLPPTLKPR